MFKKKGEAKGKGDAGKEPAAQPTPAEAPAPAPAPAAAPQPTGSTTGNFTLAGEQTQPGIEAPAGVQTGSGKNPYKISPVTDIVIPVVLAVVFCGGFCATIKVVPDKVAVYGLSEEDARYIVKDKDLVVPTLLSDIAQMPPHKLLSKGENQQAIAAAKALVAKSPEDVKALVCAGQVLIEAGAKADKELGLTYMAKAAEIASYSQYIQLAYARALDTLNKDEDCIKVYEAIVGHFPTAGVAPKRELAELYMKANRSEEAVTALTDLKKTDANDPSIERQLGLALGQAGKQQEGFEEFQKGFTKEQDMLGCPSAVKAIVEAHAGLIDPALADTEKKVAKNPNDVNGMITLARLYIGANKLKEARDTLEAARKMQENNPELHEVMAEVMCRQNQATSGFDEFRLAAQQLHLRE